jgi:putative PIN family toxin of toxin-antitoxin system
MKPVRVVFDTKVVVSSALNIHSRRSSQSPPSLCIALAFAGDVTPIVSEELLAEYAGVLLRPRFALPQDQVRGLVEALRNAAVFANPVQVLPGTVNDPDDEHVLGLALGGKASFLVTGNHRHFPKTYEGIRIVSPSGFLAIILGGKGS